MNRIILRAAMVGILALLINDAAMAQTSVRTREFSGYTWEFRRSNGLEGPGPNRFLDNWRTVWIDDDGDLHLKLWGRLGAWYAAEVVLTESLGYGTYLFETIGEIDNMDPPVILGMFTYDHNPDYDHREIDIEYGLFGSSSGPNAQFVLQPFDRRGNRFQFEASLDGPYLTHAFRWTPEEIIFVSYHGHHAQDLTGGDLSAVDDDFVLARWTFNGDVPPPGEEKVHINLWLYGTEAPSRDHEVVFRSFAFVPPPSD
jgi:hypothetical protein